MRLDPGECILHFSEQLFCFLGIFQCCFYFFRSHPCERRFGIAEDAFISFFAFFLLQFFDISDSVVNRQKFPEIICPPLVDRRTKDLFPCFEIDCPVFHDSGIACTGSIYAECIGGDRDFDFHGYISEINDSYIPIVFEIINHFFRGGGLVLYVSKITGMISMS